MILRLHHYDNLGTARFVTFSCHERRSLFTEESSFRAFLEELQRAKQKYNFSLLGYVVMPNHVHLVMYPPDRFALGRVVGEIKSLSARRIGGLLKSDGRHNILMPQVRRNAKSRFVFWQRRCYDHNCRTVEAVREKIKYCHMNPVKAGLVNDPLDWPWSSYRHYVGRDDAVLEIDGFEF